MKLYTEEEMRQAIGMARNGVMSEDNIIGCLNFVRPPMELPSDEEVEEGAQKQWGNVHRTGVLGFINCGKWMRDKLTPKLNETEQY